uniref:non-specific serine/threonine protein kinase n=1 Tax=Leersia perrieri TaxID=77586 RepID=A0A0D9XVM1_9ORYZ
MARGMKAAHPFHNVRKLSPQDAWSLLKKQVGQLCSPLPNFVPVALSDLEELQIDDTLKDIGMQIIHKCDGLPLAVKVMGGLLSTRDKRAAHWEQVLHDSIRSVPPHELNDAVYLSYQDLNSCLRQCFPNYIVIGMWISEGFLHGNTDDFEQLGDHCYKELIYRNLIEPDVNYVDQCVCRMHEVVRSFAHHLARDEALVISSTYRTGKAALKSQKFLRLSVETNDDEFEWWKLLQGQKLLRALIAIGELKINPGHSLINFSSLRILHIENANCTSALVVSLHKLKHLRYLHISGTDIHMLPENIGNMVFLQYISIVGAENLMKLPDSIGKLGNLGCLNLMDTSINAIPRKFCGLTNLRTLRWFLAHMEGDWCSLQELGNLSQLRVLGLYVSAYSFAREARLGEKEDLTELVLACSSNRLEQTHLIDELAPPPCLEMLVIKRYSGSRLPSWMWVPAASVALKGLRHMTLYSLSSYCTQLPDGLGQLPLLHSLQIIRAPGIRRVGIEFQHHHHRHHGEEPAAATFPRLHELVFDRMVEWEEWEWEQLQVPSMPELEVLTVRNCKLSTLPPGLAFHAISLKRLVITDARHLQSLENFGSVVELDICFSPELRISNIPKLRKLTIMICPELTVLEGVPQLNSLVLEDYEVDTLPEYLRSVDPMSLLLDCNLLLLKSISMRDDGPEWQKIRHIRDVRAYAEHRGHRRKWYVLYTEDSNNFETNIHDSSLFKVDPHDNLIGIDGPCENIIKVMMNDQDRDRQGLEVVCICGVGGLGKTTIAKAVYGKIVNEFDCRAFVSVSPVPDEEKIMRSIFDQVCCRYPNSEEPSSPPPIDTLKQFLQDKRYLIVLDDIWDLSVWEAIKPALTGNNKRSGIIATTCKVGVAESIGGVYKLPLLSYEDSKREVSKRILKKCGQLPLVIITLSSLLPKGLTEIEEWKKVCNSIGSGIELGGIMKDMRKTLRRSYDDLPEHLQSCLLYISIFPEDYVIRRDNLVQRWIAEELVSVNHGQSLQELGESYLYNLIDTGMIQPVEFDTTGKAVACKVPVMMLDLIVYLLKANKIATTILSGQQWTDLANKQVERLSLQLSTERHFIAKAAKSFRHTSSLSVFCDAELMTLLPRFQKLRVLHIEGCNSLENKHIIKCLRNSQLRYLIVGSGGITEIPRNVGNLRFLQILDLRATEIKELPPTIIHLDRLRCLLVSRSTKVPAGIGNLQALEELADVDICKSPGILEDICTMPELRVLRINLQSWNESYSELLVDSLCKMSTKKLKYLSIVTCCSLDFESGDNNIQPVIQHLEKLEILRSTFYRLPFWIGLLNNLLSLSIEVYLFEDAIKILGKLPALLFLSLTAKGGDKLAVNFRSEGFGCLKTFLLYNRAMGIKFLPGALKSLERLELSFQAALADDLGFGLENLTSLKHAQVEIVCFSATSEVVKRAEDAIRSMIAKNPKQQTPKLSIKRTVEQYMRHPRRRRDEEGDVSVVTSDGDEDCRKQSFISIDCGFTGTPSYTDTNTGITYVGDDDFIEAGINHNVDLNNLQQTDLARRYSTIRFFPNGTRNCYTFKSLTPGSKYLLRAAFGYGNYDRINRLPTFDLYLGVNYWTTVRIVNASTAYVFEIIAVSPADYLQVCLVNIGSGTPFISGLDLRPFQEKFYPGSNTTHALVLLSFFRNTVRFGPNRYHFGADDHQIRFPDDPRDRIWQKYEDISEWTDVPDTVNGIVQNSPNDTYDGPSAVMRSVSTPLNDSRMDLLWSSDSSMNVDIATKFFVVLYFAEVEAIQGNALRQFDILLDNNTLVSAFSPISMVTSVFSGIVQGSGSHGISLVATSISNLPPLISAMEIFVVRPLNESSTYSEDAHSMMIIQTKFSVKRNWAGDPCSPATFSWDGLNCSYTPHGPPRITGLYMSSSGLTGELDASFGQLTLLQHLDLSHNNLSGPIPDFLGQVPSLIFLDLSSNNFSGSIPTNLLQKSQEGLLTLRTDNNPNLCGTGKCGLILNQSKRKRKLVLEVVPPVVLVFVVLLILAIFWYCRKKRPDVTGATNPFENRRFKYKELNLITDGFKTIIGRGGFGPVYLGYLEDGTPVAVKMRSQTSNQGNTEFLAEAQHLARVHHRNLVSLIGYCKDKKHLALVYEYMDGGSLADHLRGQEDLHTEPLTWLQRLNIALDSANGLEYLHRSCSPPLIHRDVKAHNILLTANLKAKIADFGLTRAFSSETNTHTTTEPAGTPGYLDPEYYGTSHLSEKSDVYSFGVVLLVLITAQPAIIPISDTVKKNIVLWVHERLAEGDIEGVTDPRIRGDCDLNSVWKVADLALHCTRREGRDRPTMTEVAEGIRESLQLETSWRSMRGSSTGTLDDAESVGVPESEHIRETSAR